MAVKGGIIGEVVMWCFIGAFGVLALTKSQGLSTAVGTVTQPIEYETSLIATAGGSTKPNSTNTLPK